MRERDIVLPNNGTWCLGRRCKSNVSPLMSCPNMTYLPHQKESGVQVTAKVPKKHPGIQRRDNNNSAGDLQNAFVCRSSICQHAGGSEWTMHKDVLWVDAMHHSEWSDDERHGDDVHDRLLPT
jgi:hypothetical protein